MTEDLLARGRDALARGDWASAHETLVRAANAVGTTGAEVAEAWDGAGLAAYWADDGDAAIAAHEAAFAAYRDAGDERAAARMAVWLVDDYLTFRGAPAIANGWLERATRLLADSDPCPERAWLEVYRGHAKLMVDKDPIGARESAEEAYRLARASNAAEAEIVAISLEGLARVAAGDVAGGMPRLDEASAAAVTRDLGDLNAAAWACCYLIHGCEEVRDFPRAAQWCERLSEFCERHGLAPMFATCRIHYASVLTWQGRWDDAEAELERSVEGARAARPPMVRAGVVRLAELRRRQGHWDEAEQLFAEAAGHPLATLGLANLAHDRGRHAQSVDLAERFLRGVPPEHRTERADGLLVLARSAAAAGDGDRAATAAAELRSIAEQVDTPPMHGAMAQAEAAVSSARGQLEEARRSLEDAVDAFDRGGTPLEAALARLDLAALAGELGYRQSAIREATAAKAALEHLGAPGAAARAEELLRRASASSARSAGAPSSQASSAGGTSSPDGSAGASSQDGSAGAPTSPDGGEAGSAARTAPAASTTSGGGDGTDRADGARPGDLSDREIEVLRLVADGLSNREVGERLFISPHTVKRHVANILAKLGLPSRAAAAAAAARMGLLG